MKAALQPAEPEVRQQPVADAAALRSRLREWALAEGFVAAGYAAVDDLGDEVGVRLEAFLADGRHGEMHWLAETAGRRRHPRAMWPEARSAVVLGWSYAPAHDPLQRLADRDRGIIAAYAQRRDYHDPLKARLKRIARRLADACGGDVKVFVDTAPLMEKPLAALSGLGWQGKHTNLVSSTRGSWLLLGVILTTAALGASQPARDQCGTCRRCLDICPTGAFPAPYQLDARRCISYLTIEHKGPIPRALRRPIGNRIFGCDDCLAVCPWNKFAARVAEDGLAARSDLDGPALADLLTLDEAGFRARFSGTALRRTGHVRFRRNVLIAAGNSGASQLAPQIEPLLLDPAPLVRGAAVWALGQLATGARIAALADRHLPGETDADVIDEWHLAVAERAAP